MCNDYYIENEEGIDDSDALMHEEFHYFSVCNDIADMIVTRGIDDVLSTVFGLVRDKYHRKGLVFRSNWSSRNV